MNAKLELCKELFELSGWDDTEKVWSKRIAARAGTFTNVERGMVERKTNQYTWAVKGRSLTQHDTYPAYHLGYLLRKLQVTADWTYGRFYLEHCYDDENGYHWSASYNSMLPDFPKCKSDTPEDAAAKLCIELFKQGILTKESA